jgi:hypothetical protein
MNSLAAFVDPDQIGRRNASVIDPFTLPQLAPLLLTPRKFSD